MDLLKKIRTFFSSLGGPPREVEGGLASEILGGGFRWGNDSKDFLLKAYGLNPIVFMVIDRISSRAVELEKTMLDYKYEATENPDFEELLESPNDSENFNILLYRILGTYLATGEFFLVKDVEIGERDAYFCPVNYHVHPVVNVAGDVLYYNIAHKGELKKFLPVEVLHIRKPDITQDSVRGFSTLRATRSVWESNNELWKAEAALQKNRGISGILYTDSNRPLTPTEQKEQQKTYDEKWTGSENFGRVRVEAQKMGFLQMGMNQKDLKSIEARVEHLRFICAAFNTDSILFGDPASSTYNNLAEAKRDFILYAVLPLSKSAIAPTVEFMSRSVFTPISMKINKAKIEELQAFKADESTRIQSEVNAGILTVEEGRAMLYPEL